MTAPSTTPLAALLASHPEECAAVLCALCVSAGEPATAQHVFFYLRHQSDHALPLDVIAPILLAMGTAGIVTVSERIGGASSYFVLVATDRYAIALRGAAAWLRARLSLGPRAPRYADREAIAARIAAVLDCVPSDVYLQWRSSGVDRIAVGGESLDANDIAALIKAGFEPTAEGWDVPGECGSTTEPAK